jgi:hypothetical protein
MYMKLYHTVGGQYLIHGKEFPKGTIVLNLDNGVELYCDKSNFYNTRRKLLILIYSPKKKRWYRCKMKNEYTDLMYDYYKKNEKKINPKIPPKKKRHTKENNHGTRPVSIPKNVRWSMEHPFQGGGVSPR